MAVLEGIFLKVISLLLYHLVIICFKRATTCYISC